MRTLIGTAAVIGLLTVTAFGGKVAQAQDDARAAAAGHGPAGKNTELMIAHALCMAIEGCDLQLTGRQSGVLAGADKIARSTSGTSGRASAGPTTVEAGWGETAQLEHQARRAFQASHELMNTSNRLLRERAFAPGGSRDSAARLYAPAHRYANTLFSFAREAFGWQPSWELTEGPQGEAAQVARARQARERGTDAGAATTEIAHPTSLDPAELTTVMLINHSVQDSLAAFTLQQSLRQNGSDDEAGRRLEEHAKSMADEGRRSLQQIVARLNARWGETHAGRNHAKAKTSQGWSTAQSRDLATQALELIRVLDEIR